MALGEQLCADQNVDLLRLNGVQNFRPGMLTANAVAIDSQNPRGWKMPRQSFFDTLRALSERRDILIAALRACARKLRLMAAMMTAQFFIAQMNDQAAGATLTSCAPAARFT